MLLKAKYYPPIICCIYATEKASKHSFMPRTTGCNVEEYSTL
jgi:hypothetical protein